MNRNQFIILLVLVIVFGATGVWVRQQHREAWQSGGTAIGQKLLPNLAVNDVAQIAIKSGTNELNLVRRDNLWRVHERGDYPANFSQISGLLLKLADLKIIQTEEIGPSQLGRFELLPPGSVTNAGTLVELKDGSGKMVNSVLLGKKHLHKHSTDSPFGGEGWPDGRYVQARSGTEVAIISDTLDNIQCQPQQWLNKDFFSIEKPRMIYLQRPEATNSWKLLRASITNDWQLVEAKTGEKLDSSKISGATEPFSSPSFNDVWPGDSKPEISGLTNADTLTVDTFDGFTYVAKIGPERDGNEPMTISVTANLPAGRTPAKDEKPEEKTKLDSEFKDQQKKLADKLAKEKQLEGWTFLVPQYTVDSFLKARSELLLEPKTTGTNAPPPTSTPAPAAAPVPPPPSTAPSPSKPLTSDIIRVPSAEALKRGEKIEVIKAEDAAKMTQEGSDRGSAKTNNPSNSDFKP